MSEDQNFESLRRLLTLKRHEVPPPGYFNQFSGRVIQRIRAGEAAYTPGFIERLLALLDVKPVFASGVAGALCMMLLFGLIYGNRPDFTAQPLLPSVASSGDTLASLSTGGITQPAASIGVVSSTNPILNFQSLSSDPTFGQPNSMAMPVSFTIPH
jgi:hypothetical protein